MIHRTIPQPIPFYEAHTHAHFTGEHCKGQAVDGVFFPNDFAPNFVIVRDPEANTVFNVSVHNVVTGESQAVPMQTAVVPVGNVEYLFFLGANFVRVRPGTYQFRVVDGGSTYYSEYVRLSDCTSDMMQVHWGDTCTKAGMPWGIVPPLWGFPGSYRFSMWMDLRRLGPSVITTDEEVEDDGKEERVVYRRTVSSSLLSDVVPDYILMCFHAMKHHKLITIIEPNTPPIIHEEVKLGAITAAPVARGCKQSITVNVSTAKEIRGICCEDADFEPVECPMNDAVVVDYALNYFNDLAWFTANTPVGTTALNVEPAGIHTICTNAGGGEVDCTASLPGTIYLALVDRTLGDLDDVPYYAYGMNAVGLLNPEMLADCVSGPDGAEWSLLVGSQSFIAGRFVAFDYSIDNGATWTQAWAGSEEEAASGVSHVIPIGNCDARWRARYYAPGCEYGYSYYNPDPPECCSGDSRLTISSHPISPYFSGAMNGEPVWEVDGSYNGKPAYWGNGYLLFAEWTGTAWYVQDPNGLGIMSIEDVEYPCDVEQWHLTEDGVTPGALTNAKFCGTRCLGPFSRGTTIQYDDPSAGQNTVFIFFDNNYPLNDAWFVVDGVDVPADPTFFDEYTQFSVAVANTAHVEIFIRNELTPECDPWSSVLQDGA